MPSIRALSEVVQAPLPYDDLLQLRSRMWDISPTLLRYDTLEPPSLPLQKLGLQQLVASKASASSSEALRKPIKDFYRTDPISRASVTMAACSKAFVKGQYETNDVDDMKAQASYA
jgi:NADH dehydrogenase (ubiquinone) Fe-S protein 1